MQKSNDVQRKKFQEAFTKKALSSPFVLQNFDLTESKRIGTGASSIIYSLKALQTSEKLALKVLIPENDSPEMIEQMGRNELAIISKLETPSSSFIQKLGVDSSIPKSHPHPHIVEIKDRYKDDSFCLIAMELGSRNLEQIPMDLEDLLQLAMDLVLPLKFAHSVDVVHMDIKPQNVIVFEVNDRNEANKDYQRIAVFNKRVVYKLSDWGGGVVAMAGADLTVSLKPGDWEYTTGYAAPELLNWIEKREGKFKKSKFDVYALGKTLMFACGVLHKDFRYTGQVYDQKIHDNILNELFGKYKIFQRFGQMFGELILSMVSFEFKKRPSFGEIQERLEEIVKKVKKTRKIIEGIYENYLVYDREGGLHIDDLREAHKKDLNKNVEVFEFGSEVLKIKEADVLLGRYYLLHKDVKRAAEYFERAEQENDFMAVFNLGVINSMEEENPESTQKMIGYYKKAEFLASEKSTHCFGALNNLGTCYQKGNGVEKNEEDAMDYYTRAANKGNSDALRNLGMLLLLQDKKEDGKKYLEMAAAKKHNLALGALKEFVCRIF